jgi:opacity protein-like surface antigen
VSFRHVRIGIVGATTLSLSLLFSPAALAQQATPVTGVSAWSVTPLIGFGFSGDLDGATGVVGVAGGYGWSDRVALEGEFSMLPSPEQSGLVEVDSTVWSLTANLLYRYRGRRTFVPYAAVGIGFGHGAVDVDDNSLAQFDESSTEFVANFGGGLEHPLNERVAIRGDFRYFFGADLVPDYWRLAAGLSIAFHPR